MRCARELLEHQAYREMLFNLDAIGAQLHSDMPELCNEEQPDFHLAE